MENIFELRATLKNSVDQKNWRQAAGCGIRILKNHTANQWDYYWTAMALKKISKPLSSIRICNLGLQKFDDSSLLKNFWAHTMFDTYDIDNNTANAIFDTWTLIDQRLSSDYAYLTREKVFYTFIQKMRHNKNKLTDFFSFITLTEKDFIQSPTNNSKPLYPSIAEAYFVEMAKILFELRLYDKCLQLIDKFVPIIKRFVYDNHIWIRRIKAKTLWQLQRHQEALENMFWIVEHKNQWFLDFEISQMLLQDNYTQAAIYFANRAIADKQAPFLKINLYKYILKNNFLEQHKTIVQQLIDELDQNHKDTQLAFELQKKLQNLVNTNDTYAATVVKTIDNNKCIVALDNHQQTTLFCISDKNANIHKNDKVQIAIIWKWNKKTQTPEQAAKIVSTMTDKHK